MPSWGGGAVIGGQDMHGWSIHGSELSAFCLKPFREGKKYLVPSSNCFHVRKFLRIFSGESSIRVL